LRHSVRNSTKNGSEDREKLAKRKDDDLSDWSLSIGAFGGIGEAVSSKRFAICNRFEGSDAGGRRCSSVPGKLSRSGREDRALPAVHTRVDEPGAPSRYALN